MTEYQLGYVAAKKRYFRKASVVMAAIAFNALQERDGESWFDATWEPRFPGYVLTVTEWFRQPAKPPLGRNPERVTS